MGFYIECCRGAEIVQANEPRTINAGQIEQVVDETTQLSAPAFKGADEGRRATFVATTPLGKITWHVFFSTGDGDPCVDYVELVSAPTDVVVQSNPEFEMRDSEN